MVIESAPEVRPSTIANEVAARNRAWRPSRSQNKAPDNQHAIPSQIPRARALKAVFFAALALKSLSQVGTNCAVAGNPSRLRWPESIGSHD
jgi:hypothetical protein